MSNWSHLALEKEVIAELNPFETGSDKGEPPIVRRETVLALISRAAQLSLDFPELLNEAALLTASALEMEMFAYAHVRRTDSLSVAWGSAADSTRNLDPVAVDVAWDPSHSVFGFAIKAGHPVIVADPAKETRFHDAHLTEHEVHAGIIGPITYREQQYGALGVFTQEPRTLAKDDALFVQSIALLLGPTRAHQNTERALAEQSRFLSSAIDSLDAMVVLLNAEGAVMQINRACQAWGGFTVNQLRGRKVWSAFFLPIDEEAIKVTLQDLRNGLGQRRCEAFFITKQGDRRRVSWTLARLPTAAGGATFLATGIDITEQHRALSKLQALECVNPDSVTAKLSPTSEGSAADITKSLMELDGRGGERRTHDRRPYSCVQSVAPCVDGKLPERHHFREVRCHDISPRGFSFLLAAKPNFDELVAAFGSTHTRLFLRARVVHTTPFKYEGRNVLLVGCEYTGRVRLPWGNEASRQAQ